jgi:hypothetical protein
MLIKTVAQLAVAVAVLLGSSTAHGQARDWAFDYRITDSATVDDADRTGVTSGRAVISKGRVRVDMKGLSISMPRMAVGSGDEVSIIVEDNGRLVTYILPRERAYMQFNPVELVRQMDTMMEGMRASMKFDVSAPDPKLENLGKGPVILGHQTVHYRITSGMKMTVAAIGERETMEMSNITDHYFAPGLGALLDPFSSMKLLREASSMYGSASKVYRDKMRAAQSRLPKVPELRAVQRILMTQPGMTSNFTSVHEITKIQRVNASPDLFIVPKGFKKVDMGPKAPVRK